MKRTQIAWTDGHTTAAIRPSREADLAALSDFFAGLSERTRYLRFFGPVTPGPALLRSLAGCADAADAVIAVRGTVIVGHAMAVDRIDPPGTRITDIGVVVADDWQGRGLGSALMRAVLTGARARGVTLLEMDVLGHNRQVLHMITSHWPAARIEQSRDCVSIRIRLPGASNSPAPSSSDRSSPARPQGRYLQQAC
jgi:GNAT superfamily N-acetyltransferase